MRKTLATIALACASASASAVSFTYGFDASLANLQRITGSWSGTLVITPVAMADGYERADFKLTSTEGSWEVMGGVQMAGGALSNARASFLFVTPFNDPCENLDLYDDRLVYYNYTAMPYQGTAYLHPVAAVPEPGTLALMSLGLLGLAWRKRT